MRIITGSAKGARLETPEGLHTRPTAERTKEAIFSAIQFSIEGRKVLDIFSGSGQMALEALSRGAASAVAIDNDRNACEIIRRNAEKTRLSDRLVLRSGDAVSMLGKLKGNKFSIIFADPPYASGLLPAVLRHLRDYELCEDCAYIILESSSFDAVFAGEEDLKNDFSVYRQYKYGVAYITILQPKKEQA